MTVTSMVAVPVRGSRLSIRVRYALNRRVLMGKRSYGRTDSLSIAVQLAFLHL